jgi:hypothetical protein
MGKRKVIITVEPGNVEITHGTRTCLYLHDESSSDEVYSHMVCLDANQVHQLRRLLSGTVTYPPISAEDEE